MRPIVRFTSDNAALGDALNTRLVDTTLTDNAGMVSDTLTVTLDDADGRIVPPRKGVRLTVMMGYAETSLVDKGTFTVDEVSAEGWPRKLVISGRAAELRETGIKAPKTRSWTSVSIGDLVKTIAGEHGLLPKVSASYAGEVLAQLDQAGESDLHLLTRLAVERGAIAKPAGKYLLFVERGQSRSASGAAMPVIELRAADISRFRATFPDRGKYSAVKARYYDVHTADHVDVIAGSGEPVLELPQIYTNEADARAAVDAKYKALRRGQSQLSVNCVGDPRLQAEATARVSGLGAGIDGDWVIESVVHSDGEGGYSCAVTASRNGSGEVDDAVG